MNQLNLAIIVVFCFLSASIQPAAASGASYSDAEVAKAVDAKGRNKQRQKTKLYSKASWYGSEFHGKRTASGQKYDMYAMSAAHKSLPLLSYAKVTNPKNHKSVIVRITDRGPFHGKRDMDLSYAAAKKLGIRGVGPVTITPLGRNQASLQQSRTSGAG